MVVNPQCLDKVWPSQISWNMLVSCHIPISSLLDFQKKPHYIPIQTNCFYTPHACKMSQTTETHKNLLFIPGYIWGYFINISLYISPLKSLKVSAGYPSAISTLQKTLIISLSVQTHAAICSHQRCSHSAAGAPTERTGMGEGYLILV
jgi:hypothetical protein